MQICWKCRCLDANTKPSAIKYGAEKMLLHLTTKVIHYLSLFWHPLHFIFSFYSLSILIFIVHAFILLYEHELGLYAKRNKEWKIFPIEFFLSYLFLVCLWRKNFNRLRSLHLSLTYLSLVISLIAFFVEPAGLFLHVFLSNNPSFIDLYISLSLYMYIYIYIYIWKYI